MQALDQQPPPRRILRIHDVRNRTGYSNATIYRKMADGTFPKTVRLGPMMVGWVEAEINEHIDAVIAASREAS